MNFDLQSLTETWMDYIVCLETMYPCRYSSVAVRAMGSFAVLQYVPPAAPSYNITCKYTWREREIKSLSIYVFTISCGWSGHLSLS